MATLSERKSKDVTERSPWPRPRMGESPSLQALPCAAGINTNATCSFRRRRMGRCS